MHESVMDWFRTARGRYPAMFTGTRVLEVGSRTINGSVRELFEDCEYIGLDLGPGPGVDVVCLAGTYDAPTGSFDVVCSSSCFEHDMFFPMTLQNMVRLLRPGGLMVWTCGSWECAEHGTCAHGSDDSPVTVTIPTWCNWYHGVTIEDIRRILNLDSLFLDGYILEVVGIDTRFMGIRS